MKLYIRFISLVLVIIFIGCFGCSNSSENSNSNENNVEVTKGKELDNESFSETGEYIIKDKKTDYVIVINENAGANIITAVDELNLFISEATDVEFNCISDTGLSFSNEKKYISIGDNNLLKSSGITLNENLGNSGTQIVTKGKSIFLFGNNDLSSLYSVYDFLSLVVSFDYIYKDCYNLDHNVSEIKLREYNIVNIPDIEYRSIGYGWNTADTIMTNRMRVQFHFGNMISVNGLQVHNSVNYVKDYVSGHEEYWYSTDGTQLCYTARGNKEEYDAMQNACLETLKSALKADLVSTIVTLTQQDTGSFCSCEKCKEVSNYYGAKSAVQLLFVNDLRAKVDEWFNSEDGKPYKRDLEMIFFSYHDTADVPATYDEETKTYTANHDIKCAEGVSVWYAPIQADFTHSLYASQNEGVLKTIRAWRVVNGENMFLWVYSTGFHNYFAWYNSFDSMQDTYKLAKEVGAMYIFDQGQHNSTNCYSWSVLKQYLNSKLAWDCDADVELLTNRFFDNYFGPVSHEMKQLYLTQRVHLKYLSDNTAYSCARSCSNGDIGRANYWPKSVLLSWLDKINSIINCDAMKELKRENEDLYTQYYYRIANERLSILYMLVELYSGSISSDILYEYKKTFIDDAKVIGIDYIAESSDTLETIISNWEMN